MAIVKTKIRVRVAMCDGFIALILGDDPAETRLYYDTDETSLESESCEISESTLSPGAREYLPLPRWNRS